MQQTRDEDASNKDHKEEDTDYDPDKVTSSEEEAQPEARAGSSRPRYTQDQKKMVLLARRD